MSLSNTRDAGPAGRRRVLKSLLATALAASGGFASPWLRSQGGGGAVQALPLAPGLTLWRAGGANVVAMAGEGGDRGQVLLVDGGPPDTAETLIPALLDHGQASGVAALFNTHWHLAQTGANDLLGRRQVPIIAHAFTRQWMSTDFWRQEEQRTQAARAPEALPTDTFHTGGSLTFSGEEVRYGHLPAAHTDGDLYVFFPRAKVLVVGDALSVGHYPRMDLSTGGWIGGVAAASEVLLGLSDEDTLIVPAAGPVQGREALRRQFEMASTLTERFISMIKQGMSVEDMLAAGATREFDPHWGDPADFVANACRGLWGHYKALGVS